MKYAVRLVCNWGCSNLAELDSCQSSHRNGGLIVIASEADVTCRDGTKPLCNDHLRPVHVSHAVAINTVQEAMTESTWKKIAQAKQQQRSSKIPPEWRIPDALLPRPEKSLVQNFPSESGLFTDRELLLTEANATEVVAKIASGEWTALEVMTAICKRAAVAQQLLNCVTEIMFDQALARAKELDEGFAKTGQTIGPLHGLPIR
nr:acetamidase [Quercus suber]